MIGHPIQHLRRSGVFGWLYIGMLFLSFFFFSLQYINAPFLEQYLPVEQVGIVFAVTSFLSAVLLLVTPTLIRLFGIYRITIFFLIILYTATLTLASAQHVGVLFVSWAVYFMLLPILYFVFDIFLESSIQTESSTGGVRGVFLTMGTLAALVSPLLASLIVSQNESYQSVFLLAAGFLIPLFFIVAYRFYGFIDPPYTQVRITSLITTLRKNKDICNVTIVQFILRLYFAGITIYLPIYLYQNMGMPWEHIGIMLFIMLVPYLLIEIPSGLLADKKLGEKEMLIAGLVITSLSTAALFFISTPSLVLWSAAMFVSRIGASLVNTMSEVYFFKKVSGSNTDIITGFRLMRPLSIVVAPLFVSAFLLSAPFHTLWLLLAVLMATAIPAALRLRDTL